MSNRMLWIDIMPQCGILKLVWFMLFAPHEPICWLASLFIRVNAQLIDSASGNHIWADRFNHEADNIFNLQDEIISATVNKLTLKVHQSELSLAMKKDTENLKAYDYYLQGYYHWLPHPIGFNLWECRWKRESSRGEGKDTQPFSVFQNRLLWPGVPKSRSPG